MLFCVILTFSIALGGLFSLTFTWYPFIYIIKQESVK